MKEFLFEILKKLKRWTGVNQYEQIASLPSKEESQQELETLLGDLLAACAKFPYIPDEDKKRVIKMAIIDAEEFYSLNARFVYKALQRVSAKYWKEISHQQTNALLNKKSNAIPLSECKPEIQEEFKKTMAALMDSNIHIIPAVDARDIERIKKEDENRQTKKAKTIGKPLNTAAIERHERLQNVIKELGLNKCNLTDLKKFKIGEQIIRARTKEEAKEVFNKVYKPNNHHNGNN